MTDPIADSFVPCYVLDALYQSHSALEDDLYVHILIIIK